MLSRYLYSSRIDEVSIFPRTVLDSRIAWSHPSSGVGVPKASLRRKGPTLKLSPFVLRLLRKPMVKVRAIYRIVPQPCLDCQYSSASCDAMKNASDEDEVGTRRTTMRHVRFTWSAWTGQQSVGGIAGARDCWLVGLVVGVLVLVALHVTGLVRQIDPCALRFPCLFRPRRSVACGSPCICWRPSVCPLWRLPYLPGSWRILHKLVYRCWMSGVPRRGRWDSSLPKLVIL